MCEPLTIAGLVMSAAGTAASAMSQNAYVEAQQQAQREAYEMSKRAREQEQARQAQFEQEAATNWDTSRQRLTADQQTANRDRASETFMQRWDQARPEGMSLEGAYLSGQNNADDTVKREIAARTAEGAADARRRVQALANLNAYGTAETGNNRVISDLTNSLTTINGLRRGSLGVSQQEQSISPAQVSQGSGGMMGSILSGLGGLATRGGARGSYF